MKVSLHHSVWAITLGLFVSVVPLELSRAQAPKGKPVTVRGKISAVEGLSLKVATTAGEVLVRFTEDVRIGGVVAAQLSDITAGSYVGTTAVKQGDGNLKALEVHIFPENARGTGEGAQTVGPAARLYYDQRER